MPKPTEGRAMSALSRYGALIASAAAGLAVGVFLIGNSASGPAEGGARAPSARMASAPPVTLSRVGTSRVDQKLTAVGTGRALQSLTLTADVAGVIAEIRVKPGDEVETRAAIIALEQDEQQIAVARAEADYKIARTNASRFRDLISDESASALEYEAAQNELTATTAALQQARYDLERRTIRAPFAGVVGLITLDVGDFLPVGANVTTIDDVSAVLIDFVVPEGASSLVKPGLAISAVSPASGGRAVKGEVRAVDSRIDPASRTRRVEAVLTNEDHSLIPGSTFAISFDAPGRTVSEVPGLAVQWDRAGAFVWRVGVEGAAERVPVVIVQRTANAVLVDAALSPDDMVVSEGADLVRAGTRLEISHDETAGAGRNSTAYD